MLINYDLEKINNVLNDFFKATGVRIDLFDSDFSPISSNVHNNCDYCKYIQSDSQRNKNCISFDDMLMNRCQTSKKNEREICPFGLTNIVSPIFWNKQIIGYLYFGQMKMNPLLPATFQQQKRPSLEDSHLQNLYSSLSLFDNEKVQSISNLAQILISQILTEEMLKPDFDEILQNTIAYINENLEKDLSIKSISKKMSVSKNVLYSKFHNRFDCTVGEYINKKRIEKSIEYLTKSAFSIEEVSQKCGFSSASYYTKLFKAHTGVTPLKFKKMKSL